MKQAQNLDALFLRAEWGGLSKRIRVWGRGLNGNLPNLLTLLCCKGGHRGGYLTQDPFRNNKRTKLGYPTCGSNSSHLYKDFVKAPVTDAQRASCTCVAIFIILLNQQFFFVAIATTFCILASQPSPRCCMYF